MADGIENIPREIQAAKALKTALGADAEDLELLHDMIEGETELLEMVDGVVDHIQQDQEIIDGIGLREHDLKERKTRIKSRQARLKAMVEQVFLILEETKIERPEVTLGTRKNADKIIVTEEEKVPTQYWKTGEPTLDKKKLNAAVTALNEDDEPIPGVVIEPQPRSLTIRKK